MIWEHFNLLLIIMSALALVVFVCLFFVDAGYGKFYTRKWGPAISNRTGWVLMESPVFIAMLVLCLCSERREDPLRLLFLIIFEIHYFHRAFIFPSRIKSESKMPFSIIAMGMLFNTLNAIMQGGWLFYVSPEDYYGEGWLLTPQFIAGLLVFIAGDGNQHPVRQHHTQPPQARRHQALPAQGRNVQICDLGELLRPSSWNGSASALLTLVLGRSSIRALDLRQPLPEGRENLRQIPRRVRGRVRRQEAQAHNTLHILVP